MMTMVGRRCPEQTGRVSPRPVSPPRPYSWTIWRSDENSSELLLAKAPWPGCDHEGMFSTFPRASEPVLPGQMGSDERLRVGTPGSTRKRL